MATGKQKSPGCSRITQIQGYIDDLLSDDERRDFSRHLSECSTCQEERDSILQVRAAIRSVLNEPMAPLDKHALFAGIEAGNLSKKESPSVWRIAAVSTCVVLMVVAWVISRERMGAARLVTNVAEPSKPPQRQVPRPVNHGPDQTSVTEPVLVTYLTGKVRGPLTKKSGLIMPLGRQLYVEKESKVGLRLDDRTSVAVLGDSLLRISWKNQWELELDRGIVTVHLDKPHHSGLSVVCSAGSVRAIGTTFSVQRLDDESCSVNLIQGRLSLSNKAGQHFELKAPISRILRKQEGMRQYAGGILGTHVLELSRLVPARAGLLSQVRIDSSPNGAMVQMDGMEMGKTPLFFLQPARPVTIRLRAEGFLAKSIRIFPEPGARIDRHVTLKAIGSWGGTGNSDPLAKARELLAKRQVALAMNLLAKNLSENPDDPRSLMLLADAYRMSSKYERSLDTYLRVAALSDDDNLCEAAMYHAGMLRLNQLSRPEQALVTFRSISRQFPKGLLRQEVTFHLAECYLSLKDYDSAVRSFKEYLRLYPAGTRVDDAKDMLNRLEEAGWR